MLLKISFIGFYTIEHIQRLLCVSRLFHIIKDFWSLNKNFERQSTEYFFKNPSESLKVLLQGERPMGAQQDAKAQVSQLAPNPCFSLISNDSVLGSTGRSKPNSQITTKLNNYKQELITMKATYH